MSKHGGTSWTLIVSKHGGGGNMDPFSVSTWGGGLWTLIVSKNGGGDYGPL